MPQADTGAGLVDEIDGLVRQEPVGDVLVGVLDSGLDGLVGVRELVVRLVALAEALENLDSLVDGGLRDLRGGERGNTSGVRGRGRRRVGEGRGGGRG